MTSEFTTHLLEAGADPFLQNKKNETAEKLAKNDEIRRAIALEAPEKKLEAFEKRRAALAETKIQSNADKKIKKELEQKIATAEEEKESVEFTEDEARIKKQLEKETSDLQILTALSFRSAINDIDFVLAHLDRIKDFSSLPDLLVRIANLMASFGDDMKLKEYSRTLLKAAATQGHAIAEHIVTNYAEVDPHVAAVQSQVTGSTASLPIAKEKIGEARLKLFDSPLSPAMTSTSQSEDKEMPTVRKRSFDCT